MAGKKYLCGFADKSLNASLKRFAEQAKQMNVYNDIYLYTEDDLDKAFYHFFANKFILNGFGYWVWKPQIILQTLEKIDENDLLQYTDIGCHLNKNGIKRLSEYFEMVEKSETGLLTVVNTSRTDKQFTKGDLFDYFGVRNHEINYPSYFEASVLFIRKCVKSVEIIHKWLQVFYDDFSLVDDSPSKTKNFPEFKWHKNDQSVLSMLVKINKVPFIDYSEIYSDDWEKLKEYPILVKRDKIWKENIVKRIAKKIAKIIERGRWKISKIKRMTCKNKKNGT